MICVLVCHLDSKTKLSYESRAGIFFQDFALKWMTNTQVLLFPKQKRRYSGLTLTVLLNKIIFLMCIWNQVKFHQKKEIN